MKLNPFILIVSTILISGYVYLGFQLIQPLEAGPIWNLVAWGILAAPFAMILWLPLVYWKLDDPLPSRRDDLLVWSSYLSMGMLSFLFAFTVLRDLILLCARVFGFAAGALNGAGFIGAAAGAFSGFAGGESRVPLALLDSRGSLLILTLALMALFAGLYHAKRIPGITRVELAVPNLVESLIGLKLAQISDLHIGSTIQKPFVEQVVKEVNSLGADIIALTGDIVDGMVKQLAPHIEPLRDLRSTLGTFYVTGNHEHYWEADAWIQHVRSLGITPLLNTHVVVEKNGSQIVVAGVLDLWAARSEPTSLGADPRAALDGAPEKAAFRLLLAHQPNTALAAAPLGYDLQLSGHTHGGQFLPWTLAVRWFQPFARGLHQVGKMWLYVNRGTGYWGPPVRLGSPSEITLITLVRG